MNAPLHGNTRTLVLTGASRGIGHATVKKFGANGWREEYGEAFSGSTVIILPDNDEPGFAFAAAVKSGVEDYGGQAVIIELPRLGPKGDIVDWDGTAEEGLRWGDKEMPDGTYYYVLDLHDPEYPEPYVGFLYLAH